MSVQVAITIDVEFTIGGAFTDPAVNYPVGTQSVECRIDAEGAGVDFILDTLENHGLKGVFFVEVLNTSYFGDEPMGAIARKIHERGHDVQFHAHPCWTAFSDATWQTSVLANRPSDSFAELCDADILRILDTGRRVFSRWGLPSPCAFRAGNLQVDTRIYPLLEQAGIPLSSNIGLGTFQPAAPQLRLAGGRHWIGRTLEIPVSAYPDLRLPGMRRWKTFTVVGTGGREARQWLGHASQSGVGPIVVLTHPAEFIRRIGADYTNLRRNDTARSRFRELCGFLKLHPGEFEVVTFSGQLAKWTGERGTDNPQWHTSPLSRFLRVVENRISDYGFTAQNH